MNTPSHAIINLALLNRRDAPQLQWPIVIGSILPDMAIFFFFFWAQFIKHIPPRQIWTEEYFRPFWQNIFAVGHSIPLALVGLAIAVFLQQKILQAGFASMMLHSLLDLPVHHDDAHRHFFPLSNYRFISPFSYWDSDHYGDWIALLELILVLVSTCYIFRSVRSRWGKGALIAVNVFYITAYAVMSINL